MLNLKGKDNTVGLRKWLAVLFFLLLPCFVSCSDRIDFHKTVFFALNGTLYRVYSPENELTEECDVNNIKKETIAVKNTFFQVNNVKLNQRQITEVEENYVLGWDSNSKKLLLLNSEGKILSSKKFNTALLRMSENFLLAQTSSFEDNKGFKFDLYRLNINLSKKVFSLEKVWEENLNCFVSDTVFYDKGVFIAGATQDDKTHMVYNLCENEDLTFSIKECFTVPKNSDFLRLVASDTSTSDELKLYAFISCQNKSIWIPKKDPNSKSEPFIEKPYRSKVYNIDYKNNEFSELDLTELPGIPEDFECFFGFGFNYKNRIMLPASIDSNIYFISLDFSEKTYSICKDVTCCFLPVGLLNDKYIYVSRDVLKPDQFYGISVFDGNSVTNLFSLQ